MNSRVNNGGRVRNLLLIEMCEDGTVGGSHRVLHDLAVNLDRSRFRPMVAFYQHNVYVKTLDNAGVPVHVLEDFRRPERLAGGSARVRALLPGIRWRMAMIRSLNIDIVHLNNVPTTDMEYWWPACRLTGTRLIAHVRNLIYTTEERLDGLRRRLAGHCDEIIAVSRYAAQTAVDAGISARRMRVIYDGVDLRRWSPWDKHRQSEARRSLGIAEGEVTVLIPGNIKRWKGQLDGLAAFRLLPVELRNCRVLLAGGTPPDASALAYAEELRHAGDKLASEGGPRVSFLGARPDMETLYAASDIVLHCAIEPEPWGLVVLEAMAMGRPVIASPLGGPGEMVAREAGLLADPRDPAQLAGALSRVLGDAALRQQLSVQARRHAESFDLHQSVTQMMDAYDGRPPKFAVAQT